MRLPLLAGAVALRLCLPAAAAAAATPPPPDTAGLRAELERQKAEIQARIDALDAASPAAAVAAPPQRADDTQVVVTARVAPPPAQPVGQTAVAVPRDLYKDTPAFSVGDILKLAPGVSLAQGNGPRDVSVSVRGSNARQAFAIRNVQVFEDGFPVTQPDGTARSDLTDPHAYASVDVVEGPSSSLYGDDATGGALLFHTRSGGDIDGIEAGADFGGYGYFNDYATVGGKGARYAYAAFASNVRAEGATGHTGFSTTTENVLATYAATPRDRVTFKFINNDLDADLSLRLSRNQFRINPLQQGCASAATPGCATLSLYANGFDGTRVSTTADAVGSGRHDRRTIVGARYEHDLDDRTTWSTTADFDNRDIRQPTGASDYRGTYPSFNIVSDIIHQGQMFGRGSTWRAGAFFNYENINSDVFNVLPVRGSEDGGLTQTLGGHQLDAGVRGREELALTPTLTGVVGLGLEHTELAAGEVNYGYPAAGAPTLTPVGVGRTFFNVAPEASLVWRPQPDWTLHARISTGYGTPQVTNLFVTPRGVFGDNTELKTQTDTGVDLGAAWSRGPDLHLVAALFDERFDDELVTQSAGVNLQSYTFNAPHSEHRGAELGLDWRPLPGRLPGARLYVAYLYDDQRYTAYVERLTTGAVSAAFDRAGKRIPGVTPQSGTVRLIYDQPAGPLRGLGGFVEGVGSDAYPLDNANLLEAPGYVLVNLDLHYAPPAEFGPVSRLSIYVDVQNLLDRRYVASASNVTDSLDAVTRAQNGAAVLGDATGSIYAGAPRTVFGGVRVKF